MTQQPADQNTSIPIGLSFALTHDAVVKSLQDYHVFQIVFFAMLFSYVPFSIARIVENKPPSMSPANPALLITRAILHVGALCFGFYTFSVLSMVQAYVILFCTR